MKTTLRHRQFVVAVGGIVTHFHESPKKVCGLGKFLISRAKIRQLQKRFGKIRVRNERLLKQFFRMHDPTQLNRQGPDVGDNYRSAIFYLNEGQKMAAQKLIDELNKSQFAGKIVTTLEKATTFWPAEDYHQKYSARTGIGMCHIPYAPV